ncbi:MAG: nucleotide exchange factor GrpE [Candidatus Riflebacteria bacterium]|nr:nucleotide exchange factor GrpE [Candidatus Riflebacteria bacterium]
MPRAPGQAETDKWLQAFDFASEAAERERHHQEQMRSLLLGILEVVHGFERTRRALPPDGPMTVQQAGRLVESCGLMGRHLLKVLRDVGVEPFESLGKPLDLERNTVQEVLPTATVAEDTVVEEVAGGFTWNGEILLKAQVVVAAPVSAGARGTKAPTGVAPDRSPPGEAVTVLSPPVRAPGASKQSKKRRAKSEPFVARR